MHLITLRGRSKYNKMIQVVVDKNPDKLLLFLQPNSFDFTK